VRGFLLFIEHKKEFFMSAPEKCSCQELERVQILLDDAVNRLVCWALAVDRDAGWDGWDEHYKGVRYLSSEHRRGPLTCVLVAEFKRLALEEPGLFIDQEAANEERSRSCPCGSH
jgi:hypothetical protein